MGIFDKIKEPVVLKESNSAQEKLEALKALYQQTSGELQRKIEAEIKIVEAGIYGENQIMYELKNSHMPMMILHDLYLEYNGCTAQIDYLILTRGRQFILECKNFIGNIEIDRAGNFTRTIPYGNGVRKEAFYSPITQNEHHLDLLKQIRLSTKKNFLAKAMFEKSFSDSYRAVIVLANPKTILNAKFAKKEIRNQVIRADQLISYIKESNQEPNAPILSEKEMINLGNFFLNLHRENPTDYVAKYRNQIEKEIIKEESCAGENVEIERKEIIQEIIKEENVICPRCGSVMVKRMAARGVNVGREFYGCSNYPKCRAIVNIEE